MIIITGGAGLIGSSLTARLNEAGEDNIVIVDNLSTSPKWKNLVGKGFVDYIHKDNFIEQLEGGKFRGKVRTIVHMGACSSTTEEDADYLMQNNLQYSISLAEHCLDNNIRFIYASSAATYGAGEQGYSDADDVQSSFRPLNRYGYSKQLFDLWALRNKVTDKLAGLKFFNVYGPNEYHKEGMWSVPYRAYHQILKDGKVKLFKSYRDDYKDGEQKRDFIYVKDCADVMLWLIENPNTSGIFNLGTGKARTWKDLVTAVFNAMGKEPNIEYIDMPDNLRDQYQYFTEAEMSKLEATGCPLPKSSIEDGVRDYVQSHLQKENPYY